MDSSDSSTAREYGSCWEILQREGERSAAINKELTGAGLDSDTGGLKPSGQRLTSLNQTVIPGQRI